jgi:DNA mismatch endonuclease (patch repair protein)
MPELEIRSALHRLGLRYSIDAPVVAGLRRRADLVFRTRRVAVFVDGCFWHACPEHATFPKANALWWRAKLAANRVRDLDTDRRLADAGWKVVRVWEHEQTADAVARICAVLGQTAQLERPSRRGSARREPDVSGVDVRPTR